MKLRFDARTVLLVSLLFPGQMQNALAETVEYKPGQINFTSILVDSCRSKKIQAVNTGQDAIRGPAFDLRGPAEFALQKNFGKCPDPLEPGERCVGYIDFCPVETGRIRAVLSFTGSTEEVQVHGSGSSGPR